MQINSILLTGDDGYNSTGTRVLANLLKDTYDVTIFGTKTQQTAVGGKITLKGGFDWGRDDVDGVKAYWVTGTPADAMELAQGLFSKRYDLILSGINWGANLGTTLFGSGTVNAALRALSLRLAPNALAVSWDLPPEFYLMDHEATSTIKPYLDFPGKPTVQMLEYLAERDFFKVPLVNMNVPQEVTSQVRITDVAQFTNQVYNVDDFYERDQAESGHYDYFGERVFDSKLDDRFDVTAITKGFISVSLCSDSLFDPQAYAKLEAADETQFSL
jgi:5'-nucleotidase